MPMVKPELTGEFATLMQWADGVRRMKVRANAETPLDARTARGFGAEGIGLCRTEHMFFEGERIVAVREMILADNEAGRRAALGKAAADAAAGFRGTVRDHDRPAGDDPPARSAAARVPAAYRGRDRGSRQGDGRPRRRSCARARPSCTRSIRCSASAACGSRSAIPRSRRCRRARSSRARSRRAARPARRSPRKSWCRW